MPTDNNTARLNVRLPPEELEHAKSTARTLDLNLSQVVRKFLREWTAQIASKESSK